MATAQLFIGYAHKSCNTEQVKEAFENALNEAGIVARVDFRTKKNDRGEDFHVFFIHFDHENRQLQHMHAEIAKHGFVTLVYARDWDRRRNAYVERYWKVLAYKQKEVAAPAEFVPRLMSLEEAEAAGISAPKKPVKLASADALQDEKCGGKKPLPAYLAEKVAAHAALTNLEMVMVAEAKPVEAKPLTTEELYGNASLDWDSESPPPPPVLRRSETYVVPPPLTEEELTVRAEKLKNKRAEFCARPKRRRSDPVENMFSKLSVNDDPLNTDENWDAIGTVE